ncbi:MAG: DJ-1/PfpI family protein, partial [Parafilimonas sp.]|nr:DJ-1/PfpI family protein [Parafilimonas sp.]
LFNATGKANVYVVSQKKSPILLINSLFILPHFTFSEIDSLHIAADVIVIPNITAHLMAPPDSAAVGWIKRNYTGTNIILSVCDGSATAAATGIYDGRLLTTHATDYAKLKKRFPKAHWVKDVSVTESGNLFSTAGVSNAVEGSLAVIKKLFGEQTMQAVLADINYPHKDIKLNHKSDVVGAGTIAKIVSKKLFRKNLKIGVLLSDSVNELELASVLDTYVRTFPKSINTVSINGKNILSKYGLTMCATADFRQDQIDELHVLVPGNSKQPALTNVFIINYSETKKQYPINVCLDRIAVLYGNNFKNCVKLTLDYN